MDEEKHVVGSRGENNPYGEENQSEDKNDEIINEEIREGKLLEENYDKSNHLIEDDEEEIIEKNDVYEEEKSDRQEEAFFKGVAIALGIILILYFAMSLYFTQHFYFGTEINCINVSGKSIKSVEGIMNLSLADYKLTLLQRGGIKEEIIATQIELRYDLDNGFWDLKKRQNPFLWAVSLFQKEKFKYHVNFTYNEQLLKESFNQLSCFDPRFIIEPKSPTFKYSDGKYKIIKEIDGNKINKDILYPYVKKVLKYRVEEISLDSINCYIKPRYNLTSPKIIQTRDLLNQYIASKITYTFGNNEEIIDRETINQWIQVDNNYQVIIDENQVADYISMLANQYNKAGRTRNFVTSFGSKIQIYGGDYAYSIDPAIETKDILFIIKNGQILVKDLTYCDIGTTYVEIDLSNQYLWFYKNGKLITHGDIVTGNVSSGHTTPKGVYSLKYKQKNAILRGPGYAAPVSYWMPFNGDIGMHDANWRSQFGGDIYKTYGSHGCINCPYELARVIFENIQTGIPVICY